MDKNTKLVEILSNEQFQAECPALETAEDMQKLFAKYGLDLTLDEVNGFCVQVACSMKEGELDEEDLALVAGGFSWVVAAAIALGVVCVGAFAIGIYNGLKGK